MLVHIFRGAGTDDDEHYVYAVALRDRGRHSCHPIGNWGSARIHSDLDACFSPHGGAIAAIDVELYAAFL
jgi:hypothetical protein